MCSIVFLLLLFCGIHIHLLADNREADKKSGGREREDDDMQQRALAGFESRKLQLCGMCLKPHGHCDTPQGFIL